MIKAVQVLNRRSYILDVATYRRYTVDNGV